jgi:hypothetical protein
VGRYINGAKGAQRPNVYINAATPIKRMNNRSVVPVMAKKTIQPKTELLLSYGAQYWKGK